MLYWNGPQTLQKSSDNEDNTGMMKLAVELSTDTKLIQADYNDILIK